MLADYSTNGNHTELDLMRIERKTKDLLSNKKGDPAHCHMIFGIIGFLSGDRKKCESGSRNACLLAPGDATVLMNCMLTFTCIGNFSESIAAINAALVRFPDNKQVLACAIMQALQSLQYTLGASIMAQYDKLAINDAIDHLADLRTPFMLLKKTAESYGMADAQMLERLETAVQTVREHGFEVRRTATTTLHDGSCIYNLFLRADSQTCADTNFHIAESLVEKFDDTGINLFSIVCRPIADFSDTCTTHGVA